MSSLDAASDQTPQDPQLLENPLYAKRTERARADKPPSRSTPLGAVAASRFPNTTSRKVLEQHILDEDEALVAGSFGTVWYKPVNVKGIDLKLEPLQPSIGTVVHGLDLARDLDDPDVVAFIRQLWLERHVVAFRNQSHVTREQMVSFVEHFGEVGMPFGEKDHVPNSPYDLNQQIKDNEIPNMLVLPSDSTVPNAASGWHADATWQRKPPMASVLMCREAPPIGGDTCFCDCFGMWEGLSKQTKEKVANLRAVHIGGVGHQQDGKTPVSVHPVARTHPETGQTSLYVQQGFVRRFADEHNMSEDEQRPILLEMKLQEGRPEYTCRLKWEPGTLAMWDNRCVLHSASGDFWPHRRFMERLTILDFDEDRRVPYYDPSHELPID
ncbi:MAG: TauD/TfdA family dioxygenase [Gammaproteobacteria bacterium]|nr:TauD/TfdA family dioxygenase [Gammaproteobacteria bacterium]